MLSPQHLDFPESPPEGAGPQRNTDLEKDLVDTGGGGAPGGQWHGWEMTGWELDRGGRRRGGKVRWESAGGKTPGGGNRLDPSEMALDDGST